jgi:hypothetical protein
MLSPCRSWLFADVSQDSTASIIGAEVRDVGKYLVLLGNVAAHWKWGIRTRDGEGGEGCV